ncbi:hypothetical protein HDG34_003338 [Paraburkholderia sp. HC6.4b]|uniref:hypothetical protein n=1 Tax=unclassified Paraburkholderia TaxID=2615204 RepID=UPI00160E6050|nr:MULTISPECIES: hypothetical protein [unclassified Paraburkholderia]MBB5409397.1 hypothetical protein [Paraburkholderia sp. HC6.4b]MBB5451126.1 hypothetical protein [Paraburkholderia sp. Kb1A]
MFNQSMNAGLNAGVDDYDTDLEVVPQIVETIGTGAPPELEEETEAITAMEERIEDLLVLRAEIRKQRGMSQALAIEGLRITPDFGDGAPMSFYSLQPGRTRLALASESIVSGIWDAIKSALAALRRMIGKTIRWIKGGSDEEEKDVSLDEAASETEKNIAALVKVAEELLDALKASHQGRYRSRDGGGPAQLSFEQIVEYVQGTSRNYFYGDQPGPEKLFLDLLHNGEYSQAISAIGGLVEGLAVIIRQRVNLLDSIVEKDFRESASAIDVHVVLHDLSELEKPLIVQFEGRSLTLDELNALLRDLRHGGDRKRERDRPAIDELYTAFSRIQRQLNISESIRSLRKLTPLMASMDSHVGALETTVTQLLFHLGSDEVTEMLCPALLSAVAKLGRDVSDLGVLVHNVLSYAAGIRLTAQMAIRLAKDITHFIVENIVDETGKAPVEWMELGARLERIRY